MIKKMMELAMKEAEKAYKKDEVPIGCVIFKGNNVISKAHNTKNSRKHSICHAEINAILKAENKIGDWRLNECEMLVTLEPCKMCLEVIRQSRIKKVYYISESKFVNEDNRELKVLALDNDEYSENNLKLLNSFFASKRK